MQTTPEARPISMDECERMQKNARVRTALDVMTERGYQATHGWHGGHTSVPFWENQEDVDRALWSVATGGARDGNG